MIIAEVWQELGEEEVVTTILPAGEASKYKELGLMSANAQLMHEIHAETFRQAVESFKTS